MQEELIITSGSLRHLRIPIAVAITVCLAACATNPSVVGTLDRNRPGLRLIESVPFFPQRQHQCGPAAMASVLNYRGLKIAPDEIAAAIYSKSARGTLTIDLILFSENKGLRAEQYSGGIEDLRRNIDASNPLIVLADYGFLAYRRDHFMAVVGYDRDHVIVHSGGERFKPIPTEDFLRVWKKTKFWTLLILKNETAPETR